MDVIYRICKVGNGDYFSGNEIISQDVMHCKTKDDFKNAIKLLYGDNVKFKHTKDMK